MAAAHYGATAIGGFYTFTDGNGLGNVSKQAFMLGNFGFGTALALLLTVVILVFAIIQQSVLRRKND